MSKPALNLKNRGCAVFEVKIDPILGDPRKRLCKPPCRAGC